MISVLLRFIVVWSLLHIVLFFVERYRYKHSNLSWYGFKNDGMLEITHIILAVDTIGGNLAIAGVLMYWILQPLIDK